MSSEPLDEVDRGVLHLLQQNARDLTPVDMAKRLPVSDGTVRNRIEKLEERGVIHGYVPLLDYEAAGLPLQVVFTCTGPPAEQSELAREALALHRVVNVRELVEVEGNLEVVAVATDVDELVDVAADLTGLGLTVQRQRLLRAEHDRPFNHFGEDAVDD